MYPAHIPEDIQEYIDYLSQELEKILGDPIIVDIIDDLKKDRTVEDYDRAMDILRCTT